MKTDLDSLMQTGNIDGLLVTGPVLHNPFMRYLTGGGHISQADLIKRRGQPAVLFHGPMERDEAAKTGLEIRSYSQYPYSELLKEVGGDRLKAMALRYQRMLTDLEIDSGRVGLYGQMDLGHGYAIFNMLQENMPGLTLVGYQEDDLLMTAMMTKDEEEIRHIRDMGKLTTDVVGQVADFLCNHRAKDEVLVKSDGEPLTIGEVKHRIMLWVAERGAETPEDTIFAIGRDAGVPHSSGNPQDLIRLGQTIVFDFYPCEAGGGYFYDFTRTWCLGYAPEEAQQLYEQVLSVHQAITSEIKVNTPFVHYQQRTCELFESMGHPTIQSQPTTEIGYVHSVGHGVGLFIHERPASGIASSPSDILAPGVVVTIEPGLYYPERGLGVRLEDTLAILPDGKVEVLAPYPMELVLPIKK